MKKIFLSMCSASILSVALYSQTFDIKEGWNFVGINENNIAVNAFNISSINSIYTYSNGAWEILSQDAILNAGEGVLIKATSSASIDIVGEETPPTLLSTPFIGGWHLVSAKDNLSHTMVELDNSLITSVWKYSNSSWSAYSSNVTIQNTLAQAGIDSLSTINSGESFWIGVQLTDNFSSPPLAPDEKETNVTNLIPATEGLNSDTLIFTDINITVKEAVINETDYVIANLAESNDTMLDISSGNGFTFKSNETNDSQYFTIDQATGKLTLKNPIDFKNPQDVNGDNIYSMNVKLATTSESETTFMLLDSNGMPVPGPVDTLTLDKNSSFLTIGYDNSSYLFKNGTTEITENDISKIEYGSTLDGTFTTININTTNNTIDIPFSENINNTYLKFTLNVDPSAPPSSSGTGEIYIMQIEGFNDLVTKYYTVNLEITKDIIPTINSITTSETLVEGQEVSFVVDSSFIDDATLGSISYDYDNNGTWVSSNVHTFATAGTYTVNVKVTDSYGEYTTSSKTVVIAEIPFEELSEEDKLKKAIDPEYYDEVINMINKYKTTTESNVSLNSLTSGWHLLGTGSNTTVKILGNTNSNVSTIWSYSGDWNAYSPETSTASTLKKAGIDELNTINKNQGFWVNIK